MWGVAQARTSVNNQGEQMFSVVGTLVGPLTLEILAPENMSK